MARSSKRNPVRARRNMRVRRRATTIRRFSKQLTLQPHKCRILGDPPAATKSLQFSGRLSAVLAAVPSSTSKLVDNNTGELTLNVPFNTTATALQPIAISWSNIVKCCTDFYHMSIIDGAAYEVCLHKVQLWGPTDALWPSSHIGLYVDLGQPFGSLSERDSGTQTSRPKIGISIPNKTWFAGSTETPIIVEMDPLEQVSRVKSNISSTASTNIGELHISFTLRVSDSPLSPFKGG